MLSSSWLVVFATLAWIIWRVSSRFLLKSPLDNIPGPPRSSILRGNFGDLFNRHAWDFFDNISRAYGPVLKLHGALGSRVLYVYDPKALNSVILKDQLIFEEPKWFTVWNEMVFGPSLLSTHGSRHRQQRKMLNPVFSISHMRHMTPIFYTVVHKLRSAVTTQVGAAAKEVNVLDWMSRTALELVGQGGLGYSFDPLVEPKPNVFSDAIKSFVPVSFSLQAWRMASPYILPYVPKPLRKFVGPFLPFANMRKLRDVAMTMDQQARLIFGGKMAALEKGDAAVVQQIGEGKDILSILARANIQASGEDKLGEDELIAQMATLVFAATDTTSNALSRTFHLLAQHQGVQDKIRAELERASPDGSDIPYDELVNLPYLDAVCRETLRLFSPVIMITREAREDTVLPLSEPIQGVDGTMMNEIPVPKDTTVLVGIRSCNRSKAIWGEDALEWKPERWLVPLPDTVGKAHLPGVYSNLMTFSGGGRSCIGFKFSQLEMKVVLAVMLRSFKFSLSEKEIYWNVAVVSYPTVGKVDTKGTLPLKLEAVTA